MSDETGEDMVIPDGVLEAAVSAYRAPRLHVNDTVHDRIIDMRAAAQVIARWAWEEALREAEEAVRPTYRLEMLSGGETHAIEASNHALHRAADHVRALRSGAGKDENQ